MISIRPLEAADAGELCAARCANAAFLAPFEPVRSATFLTLAGQESAVADQLAARADGLAAPYVVLEDGVIVGQVNLSAISGWPHHSANLGYWIAERCCGRGVGTAAVRAVLAAAFDDLGLHRVQAGTLLPNTSSRRVLERNGFRQVGIARRYLEIAGEWRDHVLFERVIDDAVSRPLPVPVDVRPARYRDAGALADLVNVVASERPPTLLTVGGHTASSERRHGRSGEGRLVLVLVAWRDGAVVGRVDVVRDDHPNATHFAEIGIVVARSHRGCGIATQLLAAGITAARAEGIASLEALVFVDNAASLGLFRRAGFVEEGVRRGRYLRAGVPVDVVVLRSGAIADLL